VDEPRNEEEKQVKNDDGDSEFPSIFPEAPWGNVSVWDVAVIVFEIVLTG
jgi:hypothetical protein